MDLFIEQQMTTVKDNDGVLMQTLRGANKMKRRFKKFKHEWTHEINWEHNLPVYGEKKKDKCLIVHYGWDDLDEEL